MKSILYVGATLMIGASIYGFVDHKKTSHNKAFIGMYEEKKPVVLRTKPVPSIEEKMAPVFASKKTVEKKAPLIEEVTVSKTKIDISPVEKIETDPIATDSRSLKDNGATEKYKKAKTRKFKLKSFSRAPLREDMEIVKEPVKPEVKTKEQ